MSDWITFPDGTRGRLSWDGEARMAARWQALLQACHGQDMRPHCDCRWQGEPVPLVVRRRVRQQDGRPVEAFHLARFPGQGDWHAPGCPFHDPDPARSGRGGYEAGVIEEQADGRLRVSLDQSLRIMPRAQGEVTPRAGREARTPVTIRTCMPSSVSNKEFTSIFTLARKPIQHVRMLTLHPA